MEAALHFPDDWVIDNIPHRVTMKNRVGKKKQLVDQTSKPWQEMVCDPRPEAQPNKNIGYSIRSNGGCRYRQSCS